VVESLESNSHAQDTPLVARAKQGDLQAFNLLVQRYEWLVYYVAFRMLGDFPLAKDVTETHIAQ
jgi:hypothetical protein